MEIIFKNQGVFGHSPHLSPDSEVRCETEPSILLATISFNQGPQLLVITVEKTQNVSAWLPGVTIALISSHSCLAVNRTQQEKYVMIDFLNELFFNCKSK